MSLQLGIGIITTTWANNTDMQPVGPHRFILLSGASRYSGLNQETQSRSFPIESLMQQKSKPSEQSNKTKN